MKLSLSWIFDHIEADWHTISIADFISNFTSTIVELECIPVSLDVNNYSLAYITKITERAVYAYSSEWLCEYELPIRFQAQLGVWYLIHKDSKDVARWATLHDFNSSKDGLIPACMVPDATSTTAWKRALTCKDYILDINNNAISNRPDLWGHRGFAREIATMLSLSLKPEASFLSDTPVRFFDKNTSPTTQNPIGITLKKTKYCSRFSGIYIDNITVHPSDLGMAFRLARVDIKPINFIVDVTNYVMLDIGQPMHAYDAKKIRSSFLVPRFAHTGEQLELLNGQTVTLSDKDYVICDGNVPIALAGIIGGTQTAIDNTTQSIFVESACFDATTIRHTAMHHKLRTEASVRFEKGLDPEQTTPSLLRMIKVLQNNDPSIASAPYIEGVGYVATTKKMVSISHEYIESSLGTKVDAQRVEELLSRLGFDLVRKDTTFEIAVPSFRATNVTLKQDILEEIGRFIGYQTIKPILPIRTTQPTDLHSLMHMRKIRHYLAYVLRMREIASYAFFDEQFLSELSWQPTKTLTVANPLSEQWYRLVTSLIPNIIGAIAQNSMNHDNLRFFECAKIWPTKTEIHELLSISGAIFQKQKSVDFYEAQQELQSLFDMLKIQNITWHRLDAPEQMWYLPHQTADIKIEDRVIGRAGKINPLFLHKVTEGDAFIFELDATFLKHFKPALSRYQALSKFPDIIRDISIFVPIEYPAESFKTIIKGVHSSIIAVDLIDFFHKPEWKHNKALTFRYRIRDKTKTLTKQEADDIGSHIISVLEKAGAQIR